MTAFCPTERFVGTGMHTTASLLVEPFPPTRAPSWSLDVQVDYCWAELGSLSRILVTLLVVEAIILQAGFRRQRWREGRAGAHRGGRMHASVGRPLSPAPGWRSRASASMVTSRTLYPPTADR